MTNYYALSASLNYHKKIGGFDALNKNSGIGFKRNIFFEWKILIAKYFLNKKPNWDELLGHARKRLCDELGCEMYPVPDSMQAPFMKIVKLPKSEKYPV